MALTFSDVKTKPKKASPAPPVYTPMPRYYGGTIPRYNEGTLNPPTWDDFPPYEPPVPVPSPGAAAAPRVAPRQYDEMGREVQDGKVLMTNPTTGAKVWVAVGQRAPWEQPNNSINAETQYAPPPVTPPAAFNPWTFNAEIEEQRRRNALSNATATGYTQRVDPETGMLIVQGGVEHYRDAEGRLVSVPAGGSVPSSGIQTSGVVNPNPGLATQGVVPGVAGGAGAGVTQDSRISVADPVPVTNAPPVQSWGQRGQVFALPNVLASDSVNENLGVGLKDPLREYLGSTYTPAPFGSSWEKPNKGATSPYAGLTASERAQRETLDGVTSGILRQVQAMGPAELAMWMSDPANADTLDLLAAAGYEFDPTTGTVDSSTRRNPAGDLSNVLNPSPYSTEYDGGLHPLAQSPFGGLTSSQPGTPAFAGEEAAWKEHQRQFISGVANEDVADLQPGEAKTVRTGGAGPSTHLDYLQNGYVLIDEEGNLLDPGAEIAKNATVTVYKPTPEEWAQIYAALIADGVDPSILPSQYTAGEDGVIRDGLGHYSTDGGATWLNDDGTPYVEAAGRPVSGSGTAEDPYVTNPTVSTGTGGIPDVGADGVYTGDEIAQIARMAGFTGEGLVQVIAISKRESSWIPTAHNGNAGTGDDSIGLMQINMLGALGPERLTMMQQMGFDVSTVEEAKELLKDPLVNLQVAYALSEGGTDFYHWGGYKGEENTYGTDMDEARAIAARSEQGGGGPVSGGYTGPPAGAEQDGKGHFRDPQTGQWRNNNDGSLYQDTPGGGASSPPPPSGPAPGASTPPPAQGDPPEVQILGWVADNAVPGRAIQIPESALGTTLSQWPNEVTIYYYNENGTKKILKETSARLEPGVVYWIEGVTASEVKAIRNRAGKGDRMFSGGYTTAPMFMAGDSRSANPAAGGAKPEVIFNPTRAPIQVANHQQTRAMMPRFNTGTDWSAVLGGGYAGPPSANLPITSGTGGFGFGGWPTPKPTPTPAPTPTPTPTPPTGTTPPTTPNTPTTPPVTTPPAPSTGGSGWLDGLIGASPFGQLRDWFGGEGTEGGQWGDWFRNWPWPGGDDEEEPGNEEPEQAAPGAADATFGEWSINPWHQSFWNNGPGQQESVFTIMARRTGWNEEMTPPYPRGVRSPSDIAAQFARFRLQGTGGFNNTTGY